MTARARALLLLLALVIFGSQGIAGASGVRATNALRTRLLAELAGRQIQVAALQSSVLAAGALTSPHALVLGTFLSSERANEAALVARVERAGSAAAMSAASAAVARDDKALIVLGRQVPLVIEADIDLASATTLSGTEATLETAVVARLNAHGVVAAETSLDHASKKTASARATATSVATTVLGATPSGYPANLSLFRSMANRLAGAEANLAIATSDVSSVQSFVATHPPSAR